jgi:mercuric ion binding protein
MSTFKATSLIAALLCVSRLAQATPQTVALNVPTMDCATCPITIKASLSKVPGVSKVKVSYERREAVIVYDDSQATVADLKKATEDVGYPSMLKSR